jgi:glycosyltransferase involved in cell wall biosynthesis
MKVASIEKRNFGFKILLLLHKIKSFMRIGMILDNEIDDDIRVSNEINVLLQAGNQVVLLCKSKRGKSGMERQDKLVIQRISLPKKIFGALNIISQRIPLLQFYWYLHFLKLAKRYKVDAIHAHDLYMFQPANRVAQKINKPLVLDLHENYPETVKQYAWTKKWYAKIFYNILYWSKKEELFLSSSNRIIVLSDHYKAELLQKYPNLKSGNMVRYSNVPDIEFFNSMQINPSIQKKENEFIIFYFGVMARRRGIFTLMEAVKKLSKKYNHIKLLLIGPIDNAEKNDFQKVMEPMIQEEILIYFPWKDISLLRSYIHISDVCVSPLIKNKQHESGVANKIFQYMYFRKPQVVSNCRPQAEIVVENKCGAVFESENAVDLAEKLNLFIANPSLIDEYGMSGYKAIVSKYNTQIEGRNLVALYDNL